MQALAKALGPYMSGEKQQSIPHGIDPRFGGAAYGLKADGTPSNTAYLYNTGGLFGRCDGPDVLLNAMVGPIGFEGMLDWVGSTAQNEFVDVLKAISESGSEQSSVCGDCITISVTACAQFYCFGRFCRQTEELQFDRLGLFSNENVPVRALFGDITDSQGNVLLRAGEQITDAFFLQSRAVGYALRLKNSTLMWTGNPANNNAPAYQEFRGFELLINTGKFDAYTELDCDSIDSFLMNFAFNNMTADGANAVRRWYERMIQQLELRAERAGFDWNTAKMFIVMTPNQWHCVARTYACAGLDLCASGDTNKRVTASADQAQDRHQEYLDRRALPIMGRWYPVVLDSQITETHGQANGTCSDHFFITTEINGEAITFGQYQDFNATYGDTRRELTSLFGSDDIAITDNGRFALIRDNSRGCFDVQALTKPRLVMRAPWLSGRIQNVCCAILQEPFPDTTGSSKVYALDGGRSSTPVPVLYGDCV